MKGPEVALAVCVVGGLVHVLASDVVAERFRLPASLGELGRLAFGIGLAVYLYRLA